MLLSGCASHVGSMVAEIDEGQTSIELEDVPFHSQVTDQCGPAALAAILNDSGISVGPEELRSRIYIPGRRGSLQLELVAAIRHFGRIPYQVDPSLNALIAELEGGRPVLVFQNLGVALAPAWHYAVVIGYLANEQKFVLRSGNRERLLMEAKSFTRSWKRGDFWAFVALNPGKLPASADADRYLRSVASTESTGKLADTISAYRVAATRWPNNSLAWLGLGNALYFRGELTDAANAYREVLQIEPAHRVAQNNLSQVYLELGCRDDALATITAALSEVDDADPAHSFLLLTQQEIYQSDARSQCP